jgi:hypothetical protein
MALLGLGRLGDAVPASSVSDAVPASSVSDAVPASSVSDAVPRASRRCCACLSLTVSTSKRCPAGCAWLRVAPQRPRGARCEGGRRTLWGSAWRSCRTTRACSSSGTAAANPPPSSTAPRHLFLPPSLSSLRALLSPLSPLSPLPSPPSCLTVLQSLFALSAPTLLLRSLLACSARVVHRLSPRLLCSTCSPPSIRRLSVPHMRA